MLMKRQRTKPNHENGFSLLEMLGALTAGTLVVLMVGSMLQSSFYNYYSISMKLQSEEALNHAAYVLKNYFSMAVHLQEETAVPMTEFKDNVGKIRRYNLNDWTASTGSGAVDTIAYFLRENLRSGETGLSMTGPERYPVTGVFFQRPTVNKYGELYITTHPTYAGKFGPTGADIRVPGIVDFEILDLIGNEYTNVGRYSFDNDLEGKNVIGGVLIKVVIRHYFGHTMDQLTWCPERFIAGNPSCKSPTPYRDTQKIFLVNIRNNILSRGISQRNQNPLNPTTIVPEYRRSADTIYFLKPRIPIGVSR